jgi:hypothetical protein
MTRNRLAKQAFFASIQDSIQHSGCRSSFFVDPWPFPKLALRCFHFRRLMGDERRALQVTGQKRNQTKYIFAGPPFRKESED